MRKVNNSVFLVMVVTLLNLTGCSLQYTLKEPSLSNIGYVNTGVPSSTITLVDKRTEADKTFTTGKIGLGSEVKDISNMLSFQNISDPLTFLAGNLEKELKKRGIPVTCTVGPAEGKNLILEVVRYQIISYRATGFSPWEACHVFDGAIIHNGKRTPIKAYFYNGKTPVWSMDEIQESCFDTPASILIKDIASKINKAVFNLHVPDAEVAKLTSEIDAELAQQKAANSFWKVLELGNTNNHKALEPLKRYTMEGDEFFKSCALSSIGTLAPENQFDFLKERYKETLYNEKYMAIKAIGDIGNEKSLSYIKEMKNEGIYASEGGFKSCVDLYSH